MNEFLLIDNLLKKIALDNSLANDAFVIRDLGKLVVTKDVLVEGVHFLSNTLGVLVGKKALRVNFSDIASMGAIPKYYMLGLVANRTNTDKWFEDLCLGLKEDSDEFGVCLIGGDTVFYDGPNTISITMFGSLDIVQQELRRSDSKVGDLVCTTGTIGDAAFGLMICKDKLSFDSVFLRSRYEIPQPRLKLGRMLLGCASACIDISDGLIQDAEHVCRESGVGMYIDISKIPVSPDVKCILESYPELIDVVLGGGDDYELLFTITEANYLNLIKKLDKDSVATTIIGKVIKGNKVSTFDSYGREKHFYKKGFMHE